MRMTDETSSILTIPEETSMIKMPYLDRLANIQREKDLVKKELLEEKRKVREKEKLEHNMMQSRWQIELFLKTHFPDAFAPGEIVSLQQSEFNVILKTARSWLWKKAVCRYSGLMASIGSLAWFLGIAVNYSPNGLALIFGLLLLGCGIIGSVFSAIYVENINKIIFNKANEEDYLNF